MTHDPSDEPPHSNAPTGANVRAEGAGAAAINAGAGATVNVDNRVGVSISGQAGDVTVNLPAWSED